MGRILRERLVERRRGGQRIYRRGRRALAAAHEKPTVEHLHEWRKQVKYLRHQLELLRPMKAIVLEPFVERAEQLGDILGDDHDWPCCGAR